MDLKKAMLERRVRAAIQDGDGRRLLDLMASESTTVGRLLQESGSAAGAVLADAVRVASTDDELRVSIGWAGSSGDPLALDEVRRVLREGPPSAQSEALSTLLVHGTSEDERIIADLLSHADERRRDDVYATLTEFERIGGADSLPTPVASAVDAERRRRAGTESAAGREMTEALDAASAARLLVSLCDDIDTTYVDPIPLDADARRTSLREQIAQIGRTAYEQGGEGLMAEVARLVAFASPHGNYVDREWTGIGSWRG